MQFKAAEFNTKRRAADGRRQSLKLDRRHFKKNFNLCLLTLSHLTLFFVFWGLTAVCAAAGTVRRTEYRLLTVRVSADTVLDY